jgi:hypothetical protein
MRLKNNMPVSLMTMIAGAHQKQITTKTGAHLLRTIKTRSR